MSDTTDTETETEKTAEELEEYDAETKALWAMCLKGKPGLSEIDRMMRHARFRRLATKYLIKHPKVSVDQIGSIIERQPEFAELAAEKVLRSKRLYQDVGLLVIINDQQLPQAKRAFKRLQDERGDIDRWCQIAERWPSYIGLAFRKVCKLFDTFEEDHADYKDTAREEAKKRSISMTTIFLHFPATRRLVWKKFKNAYIERDFQRWMLYNNDKLETFYRCFTDEVNQVLKSTQPEEVFELVNRLEETRLLKRILETALENYFECCRAEREEDGYYLNALKSLASYPLFEMRIFEFVCEQRNQMLLRAFAGIEFDRNRTERNRHSHRKNREFYHLAKPIGSSQFRLQALSLLELPFDEVNQILECYQQSSN